MNKKNHFKSYNYTTKLNKSIRWKAKVEYYQIKYRTTLKKINENSYTQTTYVSQIFKCKIFLNFL